MKFKLIFIPLLIFVVTFLLWPSVGPGPLPEKCLGPGPPIYRHSGCVAGSSFEIGSLGNGWRYLVDNYKKGNFDSAKDVSLGADSSLQLLIGVIAGSTGAAVSFLLLLRKHRKE